MKKRESPTRGNSRESRILRDWERQNGDGTGRAIFGGIATMNRISFLRRVLLASFLVFPASFGLAQEDTPGMDVSPTTEEADAPVLTNQSARVHHFSIPAPRGMITDRDGRPLATTKAAVRCAIRLAAFGTEDDSFQDASEAIAKELERLRSALPEVELPAEADLRKHWEHRRSVPMVFGQPLNDAQEKAFAEFRAGTAFVAETVYLRSYPAGKTTAHLVGYVTSERPDQHGPMAETEPRWPQVSGRTGLEAAFDEQLAGEDGLISEVFHTNGATLERQILEKGMPGKTFVTTLSLPMQELATRILDESERPGAFVVVDASSGDVLVSASNPSFDPEELSRGVSPGRYQEIVDHPAQPLFNRPISGAYPPGSIFKPFVALAALDRGVVNGLATRFDGPASLEIDGRTFRNWSDQPEGPLDVRFALLRSSNTWFYQAGIYTGGDPIRSAAQTFGLGQAPSLPVNAVEAGSLPSSRNLSVNQAVANFSIGQGDLLVSPVQAALAMAGLAHGRSVPQARLILQQQDPLGTQVVGYDPPRQSQMINFRGYDLNLVRAGMWGVVNHERGTGKAAALDFPQVYGKTGTAQWSVNGGEQALAWFAGFLTLKDGPVAFAVMTEGSDGERLFGGKNAAPMAGEFLRTIVADPAKYGIGIPERKVAPNYAGARPANQRQPVAGVTGAQHVASREAMNSNRPIVVGQPTQIPQEDVRQSPVLNRWDEMERRQQENQMRQQPQPPAREWPAEYQRTTPPPGNVRTEEPGLVGRILNIFD